MPPGWLRPATLEVFNSLDNTRNERQELVGHEISLDPVQQDRHPAAGLLRHRDSRRAARRPGGASPVDVGQHRERYPHVASVGHLGHLLADRGDLPPPDIQPVTVLPRWLTLAGPSAASRRVSRRPGAGLVRRVVPDRRAAGQAGARTAARGHSHDAVPPGYSIAWVDLPFMAAGLGRR